MLVKQQTVMQTRENRICEYNVHTCIFVCVYSSRGKIELNNHFCMEQYSEFANSAQMQKRTHTYRAKPYPCLFINTPRIFAYNVNVFQSSCGLLFHKVYVWFTSPPIHTPMGWPHATYHHGNIALISTNKQTFSTMNFQSLWLNEQWQNNTQQKCYEVITLKNQSLRPHKWWTTTTTTATINQKFIEYVFSYRFWSIRMGLENVY